MNGIVTRNEPSLSSPIPPVQSHHLRNENLGPRDVTAELHKGGGALQWHSHVTRGLSAPLKMGKIHSPQLLCRVCKTNVQERNVHPSLLPTRSSISHIPGLVAPGQYWSSRPALRGLCRGNAASGAPQTPRCYPCRKSLRKNMETMRKTNDETDGEPST